MVFLGELVQQIGVVMAVGGLALWIGTVFYRLLMIFGVQKFQSNGLVIGFYARAAGMVGFMAGVTGGIIKGAVPWPWLIAVFVLGAPSLALLLVRPVWSDQFKFELPRWGKS
jgi:hypothetical protein